MPDRFLEPDLDPKFGADYPEWQREIRQAQAAVDARHQNEQRKQAEESRQVQAERDARDAKNFKQVLAWLGIEAEPASSEIILGEHRLHLFGFSDTKKKSLYSTPDGREKEFRCVDFEMTIEFADLSSNNDTMPWAIFVFRNNDFQDDWNWEESRAGFADKFDQLAADRAHYEETRKRIEQRSKEIRAAASTCKSLGDQLLEILSQIIDERINS